MSMSWITDRAIDLYAHEHGEEISPPSWTALLPTRKQHWLARAREFWCCHSLSMEKARELQWRMAEKHAVSLGNYFGCVSPAEQCILVRHQAEVSYGRPIDEQWNPIEPVGTEGSETAVRAEDAGSEQEESGLQVPEEQGTGDQEGAEQDGVVASPMPQPTLDWSLTIDADGRTGDQLTKDLITGEQIKIGTLYGVVKEYDPETGEFKMTAARAAKADHEIAPHLAGLYQGEPELERACVTAPDMVNWPPHYTSHPSGIESIQITEHMGFCLGNAMKYIWRADLKNDAIEDLKKAVWYIEREITRRQVDVEVPDTDDF